MSQTAPIPVIFIADTADNLTQLPPSQSQWARANGFNGQTGRLLPIPNAKGDLAGYLFGIGAPKGRDPMIAALAATGLPEGNYDLQGEIGDPSFAAMAFKLGAYQFDRYKSGSKAPNVTMPTQADAAEVARLVEAAYLTRDLINTPANDLGPDAFSRAIAEFAERHQMALTEIIGDDLLTARLPLIHAVGRANAQAPRLLDLSWGNPSAPKVTLVGKGVTFDTGGLDIKPPASMLLMKKDMGGAANVLGLAHTIIDAQLPVRLRVLLPVVENSIGGGAFRPGDILSSRRGLSVEIGNTDAEGRLILADALALGDEEQPDLLLDMATLTGAARVALGAQLSAVYSTNDSMARELTAAGLTSDDPLWHMPLWAPYDALMDSRVADVNNLGTGGGLGGSITAAMFLKRFVEHAKTWVHLDIHGWAPEARAGRSHGGTDQGIRAVYHVLKQRYSV